MGDDDVVSSSREAQSPIVSRSNGVASLRKRFNGCSPLQFGVVPKGLKDDREKLLSSGSGPMPQQAMPQTKKAGWFRQDTDKKAAQAAEKEEKKRLKAAAALKGKTGKTLSNFKMSERNPLVPVFLERCVYYIEREVESEGIYRVPGNRAHVDLLYQKFDEEDNVDIEKLDIL
jgi:RhoGAP domain